MNTSQLLSMWQYFHIWNEQLFKSSSRQINRQIKLHVAWEKSRTQAVKGLCEDNSQWADMIQ